MISSHSSSSHLGGTPREPWRTTSGARSTRSSRRRSRVRRVAGRAVAAAIAAGWTTGPIALGTLPHLPSVATRPRLPPPRPSTSGARWTRSSRSSSDAARGLTNTAGTKAQGPDARTNPQTNLNVMNNNISNNVNNINNNINDNTISFRAKPLGPSLLRRRLPPRTQPPSATPNSPPAPRDSPNPPRRLPWRRRPPPRRLPRLPLAILSIPTPRPAPPLPPLPPPPPPIPPPPPLLGRITSSARVV